VKDKHGHVITDPKTGKVKYATGAGPGESNHNFGMAVDIGFRGFKFVKSHGGAEVDDWWLVKLGGAKAKELWTARNRIAAG
jgi:hypothetical protein